MKQVAAQETKRKTTFVVVGGLFLLPEGVGDMRRAEAAALVYFGISRVGSGSVELWVPRCDFV